MPSANSSVGSLDQSFRFRKPERRNGPARCQQPSAPDGIAPKPPQPKSAFTQFREHLWRQFRAHWKTIIPIAALAVGVSGWFVSGWFKYYLDHRYDFIDGMITTNLGARGGIKDTLAGVQQTVTKTDATLTTLAPFINDVVQHQFESASKLPVATLQERLPAVQHLVSLARDQKIAVNSEVVRTLSRNLLTVASTNQTHSSQIVSDQMLGYYTTLVPFSDADYIINEATDKNTECLSATGASGVLMMHMLFQHCTQHLDSILGPEAVSRHVIFHNLAFRDARIIYSGGPLKLDSVYFVNCTFELQSGKSGRKLAETLLAESPIRHLDLP
jgi:hypothetical protein